MENIIEHYINRKKFSHCYLFYGSEEKATAYINKLANSIFCNNLNSCGKCYFCLLSKNNNPDFQRISFEKFSIENSRALIDSVFKTTILGGKKIYILKIGQATREAQNAMLKVIEEPPQNTYFLIYSRSFFDILDTLKSRAVVVFAASAEKENKNSVKIEKFLRLNTVERINFFSKIKDKEEAKNFILDLIGYLRSEKGKEKISFISLEKGFKLLNENMPMSLVGACLFLR